MKTSKSHRRFLGDWRRSRKIGLNRQGHFQVIGMVIGDSEFPGDGVRLSFKEVMYLYVSMTY